MASMQTYFTYNSRIGAITIAASTHGICAVQFGTIDYADAKFVPSALTNTAATQIQEYLAAKRFVFDITLDVSGSNFEREVWKKVCKIPYGATTTASDIAIRIGNPRAAQRVGHALAQTPIELLIPTHRVVSAQGYTRGVGQVAKQHELLLAFEKLQHKTAMT